MLRRAAALLVAALAISVLPGTALADPGTSARARLAAIARRMKDAEARAAVLDDRLHVLDRDLAATTRELADVRARYAVRARAAYTLGLGGDPIVVMFATDDPNAVVERLDLLNQAARNDATLLRRGTALRRRLREQRAAITAARREVADLERRLQGDGKDLRALLSRIAAASPPTVTRASRGVRLNGRYACLVGPAHSYTDTWGDPRPGGRQHKGTDVFAPWGSPAYAVTNGVVRRLSTSYYGGLQLYLRGDDGNEYFYAHLSSYTSRAGQRVAAGEQVARVGNTGDARYTSPHVHFEVHPGGGVPVNPYPYVRRFCP